MLKFHIIKATYLSDYSVRFLFADKTQKDFDFRPYLNLDIFKGLKDIYLFKKFSLKNLCKSRGFLLLNLFYILYFKLIF